MGGSPPSKIGLPRENRAKKRWDVPGIVLIVGVGIDDDVGTKPKGSLQPGHEGLRQAAVAYVPHDMVRPVLPRYPRGLIGASIVNDQPFDFFKAIDVPGKSREGNRRRDELDQSKKLPRQI